MAYSKTIIEGHLTRDIEIRYMQSGSAVGNTGIAASHKFKTQSGEQKEETMFVDLTFFGRTAEIANQYLRKGSHVLIDGRLKLEQWTAQDGTKRSKHVVVVENLQMLGNKNDGAAPGPGATPQNNQDDPNRHNVAGGMNKPAHHQAAPGAAALPQIDIDDADIPF